jgi:RimJ/RimL family protein N-acetyltransferase
MEPPLNIPSFETERLLLRGVTEPDTPSYEKHFVDWDIISHLARAVPWPYPPGAVRSFITTEILPQQGKDKWVWGLFRREVPAELIGVIDLWRHGRPENRGFWLGRPFWGQGYMTEAIEPVMDYAFGPLGFEALTFANARGNHRSRRIKEKTGARMVRIEPREFVNPEYTETEIWELTKIEWEGWKARRPNDRSSSIPARRANDG